MCLQSHMQLFQEAQINHDYSAYTNFTFYHPSLVNDLNPIWVHIQRIKVLQARLFWCRQKVLTHELYNNWYDTKYIQSSACYLPDRYYNQGTWPPAIFKLITRMKCFTGNFNYAITYKSIHKNHETFFHLEWFALYGNEHVFQLALTYMSSK